MAAKLTLCGVRRSLVREAFGEFFGLGADRADLLVVLYEFQGQPKRWQALRYGDWSLQPTRGALHESISVLRSAMNCEAIDTGEDGYCLTEVGLAECRKALTVMAEQLALVGAQAA